MCVRWLTNGPFVKSQHLFQIFAMICASDGEEASYRNLQSLSHQGQTGKSLTLGQRGKRQRVVVVSGGVNVCPGHTHTHIYTGAISSVGNAAVFTYCNETHLIEDNLYGLCKQDFASFCIRFASQQHIRSPYGTLDII